MELFSFQSGNLYLVLELLLAELIFLYPVPKRRLFPLRFPAACAAAVLVVSFVVTPFRLSSGVLPYLFRFLWAFAWTIAAMALVFDVRFATLLSMCTAGYAVQHIAYRVSAILYVLSGLSDADTSLYDTSRLIELLCMAAVYLTFFLSFGRFSAKNECYKNSDPRFNAVSVLVIIITIGFSRLPRLFGETYTITCGIYAILCCLLALYIQFNLHRFNIEEREKATLERMHQESRKQYEISKTAMDSLQLRLHDLKHRLAGHNSAEAREELSGLKEDVAVFASIVETGNEAMDVLLTEKLLQCRKKGIRFTCSGNYALISFMKAMDLYSLFGNAMDNAIEAVEPLDEPEKKVIDLSLEERGSLIFINITNYFSGSRQLVDGVPQTTKTEEPGQHGFGFKSMRLTTAKYGGDISFSVSGELATLSFYLQRPEQPEASGQN